DAGPTILTAPFLVDELFALAGRATADHLRIVPCRPYYRIQFTDGSVFDYTGDPAEIEAEIRRFNPADVPGYRRFARQSEDIFRRAFLDLADQPFSRLGDMLRIAPDLMRLRADRSVHTLVVRHLRDERLRQVFSFHPLLIGGNPFQSSSIYSMIHFLERRWGVHFVMGGTGALVQALVGLFQSMGGVLRLNSRVEEIVCRAPDADAARDPRPPHLLPEDPDDFRPTVTGVRLASGEFLPARVVVSNGDVANTCRKLLAPRWRRKWTDRRIERMRYSMGLFVIYFGTRRTYPNLAHHTIVLGPRYRGLLDDIFRHQVLAPDFSLYLHAPTRTDPSLAPPGHECFYVLSPVPNLQGDIDWERERERYADALLASLEIPSLCPDLRRNIVTRRILTPVEFEADYDAYAGSAFQFEPLLTQSAWFRPHNVNEDVRGLYLVGAGTHPGAGVPGVLSSAKVLDRVIPAAG
ncbi:MAG: phytoene desaturase family protein, partial [Verrucomicrobiota bacterium]